ncbi:MAG TPA: hypothetical protein VJ874_06515, partial [Candidatus Thermoplasmatota archaeon]|nr:hypothetical protein [Candidatus Thermoplasmatota archaeon]
MASRGSVQLLAVAFLTALLPSAASQEIPSIPSLPPLPIDPGSQHTVITVEVPLAGAAGSGSLQVPVDGGILDIQVDPIVLPGPGGTVDVEAYVAQVRLLLPSGVALPLPSMIIQSEDRAIEGPAAEALAELAAAAEALKLELEAMADEIAAPSEPEPEPEPAPEEPDPVAEQL